MNKLNELVQQRTKLIEQVHELDAQIFAEKIIEDIKWCRTGRLEYKEQDKEINPFYSRASEYLKDEGISFTHETKIIEKCEGGYYDGTHYWKETWQYYTFRQPR